MKKVLLPLIALLFSGVLSVSAGKIEVDYFKLAADNQSLGDAQFDPTMNELVANSDGTYLLKDVANSGFDLHFSLVDGELKYLNSNINGTGLQMPTDPEGKSYKLNLTTAYDHLNGIGDVMIPAGAKTISGSLYIYPGLPLNGATLIKETAEELVYRVMVGTKFVFKIALDDDPSKVSANFNNNGVIVFNVTEKLPANVGYVNGGGETLFESSHSDIATVDGACKVGNFAGSGVPFSFKLGSVVGDKTSLVFVDGGLSSTENADAYQTLEGATFKLVNASGATVTGPVAIRPAGCYAEEPEGGASPTGDHYKVYIDVKLGDVTGFAVFESSPLSPAPKGELFDFTVYYPFNTTTVLNTYKWNVDLTDGNNCVVYNFLNSGFNIPLVFGEKQDDATGSLSPISFPDEYIKSNVNNKILLTIPGSSDGFSAKFSGEDGTGEVSILNPAFWVATSFSQVRYYEENGKLRKHCRLVLGTNSFYAVEWDMYADSSALDDIVADENAPVEYYNLQGMRVNRDNLAPGIYIRHQGGKSVKIYVK